MTSISPVIFRAYDIRGKAGSQITVDACREIGMAFGTILHEKYGRQFAHPTVVLGRDARTHSPDFESAACAGLMEAGCTVLRIGQTPSPVNYFTICDGKYDAGMQITASHNPKEDNGIKLCTREADAFSGDDLQDLKSRIEKKVFRSSEGSQQIHDAVTPYISFLTKLFKNSGKEKKIVLDAGNGVAGPVYCDVLKKIGCEVIEMYTEPDGNFPNHPADPSKHSTLKELQARVVKEKADCGFAYDGDGDRVGLVDEKGAIITADAIILLLAEDHLSRHKNAPVIFTVSNSSLLETEIKKWGGKPVMCKVGHSYVEHAMREHEALLGGEQSGHFFCGEEYFGFDDALVATLRILKILGSPRPRTLPTGRQGAAALDGGKELLSDRIAEFPRVFQMPERRPACPDDKKADVVSRITSFFSKKYPVNTLDGARIDFGDGAWAGVRYSNTSPCLSICIEARSEEKLKEVEREVLEHVGTYGEVQL